MHFTLRTFFICIIFLVSVNGFAQIVESTNSISGDALLTRLTEPVPGHQDLASYKPYFNTRLPSILNETSGLLFFNEQLWTINDSGNPPEIYQLDPANGKVLRTVKVRNSNNTDWESITHDDSNVYIGDFGNNAGNRTDLCILKITKADLLNITNDTVQAGYIHFIYPDQTQFKPAFNNTNFDCEAFIYFNDSIHLFSKNWSDLYTKHYVLPADTGYYKARLAERFNADGLVTDASINAKGNMVLLGYKNKGRNSYFCFAWLLHGYEKSDFFGGNRSRLKLGSALHLGQTEGIVLNDDNTGWFSSESIQPGWFYKPAKLFSFDFGSYFEVSKKE